MTKTVFHDCRCGAVRIGVNVPNRRAGTRVTCFCKDCQTAARLHAQAADVMSDAGGTDIWQTTPDHLEIVTGAEHLRVLRLSPKGLMRWHASCCGTPMFNTLANLKIPFVGVILRQSATTAADKIYGKTRAFASTVSARPGHGAPTRDKGFKRAGLDVIVRMLGSWISGRAKQTPLLTSDSAPIAPVEVLSKERRKDALPKHLA